MNKTEEKVMKRFWDEQKKTLWEIDLHCQLYTTAWDGSKGVYQSSDGTYFYAEHHRNAFHFNGNDFLVILPENVAKEALSKKYYNLHDDDYKIDPETYLIETHWIN